MAESMQEAQTQEGFPLKRYLSLFFRYKWLILVIFVVGTVIGVAGAIFLVPEKKVYEGFKKVVIRNPDTEVGLITRNQEITMEGSFFLEAEIGRLRDVTVFEKVVGECRLNQQELAQHQRFMQTARGKLMKWLEDRFTFLFNKEDQLPENERFFQKAVKNLQENLTIEPEGQPGRRGGMGVILSIQYANEDKNKVREVINEFVEENRRQRKKAYTGSEIVKKQKNLCIEQQNRIEKKCNKQKAKLAEKYETMDLPFNSDPSFLLATESQRTFQLQSRLTEVTSELEQARLQLQQYEKELETIPETMTTERDLSSSASPRARELLAQIQNLEQSRNDITQELLSSSLPKSRRDMLQQTLTKYNETLAGLNKELASLKETQEIQSPEAQRINRAIRQLKITHDFRQKEKKQLQEILAQQLENELSLRAKVLDISDLRQKYQQLANRLEEQTVFVENFVNYEIARRDVQVLKDVTTKVIVNPSLKSAHKLTRSKVILGVVFGSLALGLGLAFFFGMVLDASFHQPDQLEKTLGVTVVATVPELRRKLLT